ncbi:LOW QUALITY PROTEIN: neurofilament light polypeptide [Pristis pectinata]|uniref:LOW QUALITY PROTEIN: neurofilament light polypeptide n=1 Tax=Pristis pectinata TaxID=685728 RepID=UPI00223C915A|nr:LOW QUALITY PROTEIN: neurofilament light polypeptide [Pristis pectinata]
MSAYDPFSPLRKPWEDHRYGRTAKSSVSSTLYASHRPSTPKRSARPGSVSSLPSYAEKLDLAQVSTLNAELLTLRAQEREQLMDLNDRFATYIEKVHYLEQQNKGTPGELEALRQKQSDPSRLHLMYEQEIRGLRALLDSESAEKARMEAERERLREVYGQAKERYEEEVRLRIEAEGELQKAREGADKALLANSDVEGSISSLVEEIAFLKKVHGEESAELAAQVQAAHLTVEVEVAKPDLALALREIRCQYEKLAHKNMQAAEDWYRTKFATVSELASRNSQAVRSIREETAEYHRLLQSRGSEIEGLRTVIEQLQRQLESLEDRQAKEVGKYQDRISELEKEINDAKQEMARYLREYQDLLNVKMALDIEIAAYRKLLEGEEFRLSFSSLPPYS